MTRLRSPDSPSSYRLLTLSSANLKWIFALTFLGSLVVLLNSKSSIMPSLPSPPPSQSLCSNPGIEESLKVSEGLYKEFLEKREKVVQSKPKEIDPYKPYVYPYDYFVATFGCPFTVQRVGAMGDGGKWICGIERYYQNEVSASQCILYSFGISTETTFEVEMLQKTNCEIFAYDASVDKVVGIPDESKDRVHFFKKYVGDKNSDTVTTLGEAMAQNGHSHIDILKVDVEAAEFAMFKQIISDFGQDLPFSQLLIEIHVTIKDGAGFEKLYDFMTTLESVGLRPFRNELNIAPFMKAGNLKSALSEYSFLNVKKVCK